MYQTPIGILGGTFDPIHLGHLHLANTIREQCNCQKILLIPCYQSPLREQPLATANDRLQMVQLATTSNKYLITDAREVKRQSVSYTVDTLTELRCENPNIPLTLILGADAFNNFTSWHKWQQILELAHLIVATRSQIQPISQSASFKLLHERLVYKATELTQSLAGKVYAIDINPLPISGTEIRELIAANDNIRDLLPTNVWQYIKDHNLYHAKFKI